MRILSRTPVLVLAAALAAASLFAAGAPRSALAGQLIGTIPSPGSVGLVVWSGGRVEEVRDALGSSACGPRSAWAMRRGGGLIGYLYGAPEAVNAGFRAEFSGGVLPANSPLVLVCVPATAPAPAPAAATVSASLTGLAAAEAEMLVLVNKDRAANGLAPLVLDVALSDVARRHSSDMVARGYFDHKSLSGLSPFDRMTAAGLSYRTAAENIAWAGSMGIAHTSLMNSPGHRTNLLNGAFGRIGIGIVQKDGMHVMVTQNFRD